MIKAIFLILNLVVHLNLFCQQNTSKKNCISFAPLSVFDRTISISYYRKIKDNIEFSINTRIRIAGELTDKHIYEFLFKENPYWFYHRFSLLTGILFRFENLFCEPLLQYSYGCFKNQTIYLEGNGGNEYDIYEKLDRSYNSIGIIGLIGYIRDFEQLRFKLYCGLGDHARFYKDEIHGKFGFGDILVSGPDNNNYSKNVISFHLGFEAGVRF